MEAIKPLTPAGGTVFSFLAEGRRELFVSFSAVFSGDGVAALAEAFGAHGALIKKCGWR
jgi:hypothetical protein